eukprot:1656421-Pleurochrysis_carterae.AAC.1
MSVAQSAHDSIEPPLHDAPPALPRACLSSLSTGEVSVALSRASLLGLREQDGEVAPLPLWHDALVGHADAHQAAVHAQLVPALPHLRAKRRRPARDFDMAPRGRGDASAATLP